MTVSSSLDLFAICLLWVQILHKGKSCCLNCTLLFISTQPSIFTSLRRFYSIYILRIQAFKWKMWGKKGHVSNVSLTYRNEIIPSSFTLIFDCKSSAVHSSCFTDWSQLKLQTVTPPDKKSIANKDTVTQGKWQQASSGTSPHYSKTMATASCKNNLLGRLLLSWPFLCSCQ